MALVQPAFAGEQSHARNLPLISNIAQAEWDIGGQRLQKPSNRVNIQVVPAPNAPPEITTHQFSDPPGAEQVPIPDTMCRGSAGSIPIELHGVFAGTPTNPGSITPTDKIRAGAPLIVSILAPGKNFNPLVADSFDIVLSTPAGDREVITVSETGPDTARFIGMINTAAIPPHPVQGDCKLSVHPGDTLDVSIDETAGNPLGKVALGILVDPFGETFDSGDGTPISGTRVTLIDVATGQPADVFGDDGISAFPSTVITGDMVTDSGGTVYNFTEGFYRFPFARAGRYRLLVEPPQPYSFASTATPQQLAPLRRTDGMPFTIVDGSYGGIIILNDPAPVRVDVPLDRPGTPLLISKAASVTLAAPGDAVQYRVTVQNSDSVRTTGQITISDRLPRAMRLKTGTVRYNGELVTASVEANGQDFTVEAPPLPPSGSGLLTYIAEVRQDAQPGDALNLASASDDRGTTSPTVDALVRVERDGISERFTLIGRITDGGCSTDPEKAAGIGGIRVILQDGTYTVTDSDGRYHFEGLKPGLHVVQVDPSTFPADLAPVDCARNTRTAGSNISRFVEGRGGALKRADFRAKTVAPRQISEKYIYHKPAVLSDPEAAGAGQDWLSGQEPGIAWLFPEADHNPRVKALRVAIKHHDGQRVELSVNGKPVNPLAFDGTKKSADGTIRVSTWRGIEIGDRTNVFVARVVDQNGALVQQLERKVHYAGSPLNAQLLKDRSILVADGVTRPVIAVRLTDRTGKPARNGMVGDFSVPAPYAPAIEIDAQQANQLAGLERGAPVWRVEGEEGIAYIELAPTTASGSLSISFPFRDGEVERTQRIETWLDPGDRPWTVVGFAAGTIGFNTLDERLEDLVEDEDNINVDGRVALYAKGRVTGKWLMTLAYDSDKQEDETLFRGVIDPRSYYTVYADRSEQRYDAASVRRLYLKLERPQFYALFGDYETGISEPELARYQRAFNGIKAEYRSDQVHLNAFGADSPNQFRREEIQGNGLSGPYALAARGILANSERITLETRDRLRSDRIIEQRELTRHIDYDIDYLAGTLRFREPILSRSSGFDPQFIIAEYEVLGIGGRNLNAGGRATYQTADQKLKIGATAVHDEDESVKTDLLGVDVRYRPDVRTEFRAELAVTDNEAKAVTATSSGQAATAWLVEAEHHGSKFDLLAYVRRQATGYGLGQINAAETGTRKFGIDARVRVRENLSLAVTSYQEDFLTSGARRRAGTAELEYRTKDRSFRAGIVYANDRLSDGTENESRLVRLGATQQLFNGKLELDAQTEFALGGQDESIDFPARHSFSARYSVTKNVKIIGTYEIADGENIDARTARIGVDVTPWDGGRIVSSMNQQEITEYGPRTFAAYGLTQSIPLDDKWTIDFSLDGNETVSGFDRADVINEQQPVASGGFLGNDTTLTEDFLAVTAGFTFRHDDWSWNGRAEYRDGDISERYGLTTALLKQISEGSALGALASIFVAEDETGVSTRVIEAEASWAHRPADSEWSWLEKLEFREDRVRNAVSGTSGPIGGAPLLVDGNVTSRRIINSLSVNYTPVDADNGLFTEAGEYGFFWGSRYVFDRFGQDDVEGWSNVVGADIKFDLSDTIDVGGQATARIGNNFDSIAYSGGPSVGITPFKNGYISVGYNVVGFADRDFEESRYTRDGPFITFRLKFDQETLGSLGL
ncbi:hypothetical protein [uncultured Parasphingorhabdus sp.]|uniref:hypothetical protein n=1 Tax=uncultured Parasphingorhabdus sp. TaxID=2709694 RepID=UPI0030DAF9D9|tara:strand:- start:104735 stop:109774 length:5040 start_codon:yes stop_codon:yes gene_type:complete